MFRSIIRPTVGTLLLASAALPSARSLLFPPGAATRPTTACASARRDDSQTTRLWSTSSSTGNEEGLSIAVSSLPALLDSQGTPLSAEDCAGQLRGKRVAYYLSAGWCPMCTRFEPSLIKFRQETDPEKLLQLIYVPSDSSAEQALQRANALNMWSVPFGHQADQLKKELCIWAGPESLKLGMGRRSGVPALVVLSGETGQEMAFLQAESQGAAALQAWPLSDPTGIW